MKTKPGTARYAALHSINKEMLEKYYGEHTAIDTAAHFGISKNTLAWLLKHYSIIKSKEQKKASLVNSYGSTKAFYDDRNSKANKTKIDKYGSLKAFEAYKTIKSREGAINKHGTYEKYLENRSTRQKEACLIKYGVANVSKLDSVKQKKKDTMIKHFGSLENAYDERQKKIDAAYIEAYGSLENYRKLQQDLTRRTVMKKYGVEHIFESPVIQDKIVDTCLEKYGVKYPCMIDVCRSNGLNDSKPNRQFASLLSEAGIIIDKAEFTLGCYIYDFKVGKLLFEINPAATHNTTWSPFGDHSGISKYYHQLKSMNAYKHGYRCIHVFDWTDTNEIISNIYANSYKIDSQQFDEPSMYIYDIKNKQLVNKLSKNCVEIYDDGLTTGVGGI